MNKSYFNNYNKKRLFKRKKFDKSESSEGIQRRILSLPAWERSLVSTEQYKFALVRFGTLRNGSPGFGLCFHCWPYVHLVGGVYAGCIRVVLQERTVTALHQFFLQVKNVSPAWASSTTHMQLSEWNPNSAFSVCTDHLLIGWFSPRGDEMT